MKISNLALTVALAGTSKVARASSITSYTEMIEAKYGGRGAGPARGEGLSAVKPEEKREIEASICKMDSVDEFVTGTGWFTSHAGADKADLGATGKAEFGFDTECIAGSEVPTGSTFLSVGNLNFYSNKYDLMVAGPTGRSVMVKGTGTINEVGGYGFQMLVGGDNTFRIKIWEEATGEDTYDNAYDNDGGQAIEGGDIQLHVVGNLLNSERERF